MSRVFHTGESFLLVGCRGATPSTVNKGNAMLSRPHLPAHWVWRIGFTTAALAWMLLIFYRSSLSSEEIESAWSLAPEPVSAWPGLITIRQAVGHLALYGVLALLVQSTIRSWPGVRLRPLVMAAAAVAVAAGYGVTDEFHQALVPGRTASVTDWGIDVVGAIAAAGIGYCILVWHGNRQVSRAT